MSDIMDGYIETHNEPESKIESVAIYARKSRAEEGEKDLVNHLLRLKARCELNEWNYEIYKEIVSGSSLDERPQMLQLLEDVTQKKYDAVVVVDIDRLSRGKGADLDRILGILRNNDVKIVQESPYEIYDLANTNHAQMLEMKMFFGNMELMQTKKRFKEGKRLARHLGKWVSGQSPFGYDIDKQTKKLIINEEEAEVMRKMKDYFFETLNTVDTAWLLNKDGHLTRQGNPFQSKTVSRMLQNEVYTGTIVYNKTIGNHKQNENLYSSGVPFRRLPKEDWKRKYNVHPAIYTLEEHQQIVKHFQSNAYRPTSNSRKVFCLSGLCVTPEGDSYTIMNYHHKTKQPYTIGIQKGKYEEKSKYAAVQISLVQEVILQSLKALEERLEHLLVESDNETEVKQLQNKSQRLQRELEKLESELDRVNEGFLAELFTAMEAKQLKEKKNKEISDKEEEINHLNEKINVLSSSTNLNRLDRLRNVFELITSTNDHEKLNNLYKSIIGSIVIERTDPEKIGIKVNFL